MRMILAVILLVATLPAVAQQSRYFLVQNQASSPVAGASVTLAEEDGPQVGTQATDAEGRTQFDGIDPSGAYTVTVSAVNYMPFAAQVSGGQSAQNPMVITLARVSIVPPPPTRRDPEPATAQRTVALTEALFNETLAAGWQHAATGSSWLQRCQLFQGGTGEMPDGWIMRSSVRLWNFWAPASCNFTLFAGRELNEPWTLVGFTVVDGRTSGACDNGSMVNVTSAPAGDASTMPLTVHILAPDQECSAAVTEVVVNGPTDADPEEAFIP